MAVMEWIVKRFHQCDGRNIYFHMMLNVMVSLTCQSVLNAERTDCLMMFGGMMFAGIIRIIDATAPEIE